MNRVRSAPDTLCSDHIFCRPCIDARCLRLSRKTRHAFTLTELLCVLCIIAILVSIGSATISHARASGWETSCSSNIRQLGQAISLYTSDYDQVYPLAETGPIGWPYRIGAYVKIADVFQCPAANASQSSSSVGVNLGSSQKAPVFVTYLYNLHIGGIVNRIVHRPDPGAKNLSLSAVANPSGTILLADGSTTAAVRTPPEMWRERPYVSWVNVILADSYYSGVIDPSVSSPSAPRALHGDRAVVLYCDNHARSQRIETFYNPPEKVEVPGKQPGYSPCLDPATGCIP